ncbi:MAG: glycosyltransferase [Thermoplasmatota archaeon]
MKTIYLLTNNPLTQSGARTDKLGSRIEKLEEMDWKVSKLLINPPFENELLKLIYVVFKSIVYGIRIKAEDKKRTVLWSVSSPDWLHLSGFIIKFLNNNLHWVLEIRDIFLSIDYETADSQFLPKIVERFIVKYSNLITIAKGVPKIKDYFENNYSCSDKIVELPYSGLNKDDFDSVKPTKFDKYTIVYAGRFYKDWIEPNIFLEAFSKFVAENDVTPQNIQIKFYCKGWRKEHDKLIERLELKEYIDIESYVPRDEIISIMKGADLLLYIHGSNESHIYSKFWDYTGSGTLQLILGYEKFPTKEIVKKYDLGIIVHPKDVSKIKNALEKLYFGDINIQPKSNEVAAKYTRERRDYSFIEEIEEMFEQEND